MEPDRDAELLTCFWALHAAVIRRDGIEERIRAGELERELLDRSLYAAEAVIAARTELYRHLMSRGWTPPSGVLEDLAFDAEVLRQPGGSVPT